jgi:hypothetical protein
MPAVRGGRRSTSRTATATSDTICNTMAARTGTASGDTAGSGSSAIRPPLVNEPAAMATPAATPPRLSPVSMSAVGSTARVVSTYQASSGPLSSARYTPWMAKTAKNSASESAAAISPSEARLSAPAASRTGRRPRASDSPPVGNSRASTTSPCAVNATPASARVSPRSSGSSTKIGMISPLGSQRSACSRR